jgi:hypothetical protein
MMDEDDAWIVDYGDTEAALAQTLQQSEGYETTLKLLEAMRDGTRLWAEMAKWGPPEKMANEADLHVLVMGCTGLLRWHPHNADGGEFLNKLAKQAPSDDEDCGHPVLWRSYSIHTHFVRLNELDLPEDLKDQIRDQLFGGAENPEFPLGHPTLYGITALAQLPLMVEAAMLKGLSTYLGPHCDENPQCDEDCTH